MTGTGPLGRARLLVASDEPLIGETVRSALVARGFDAHPVTLATRLPGEALSSVGAAVGLLMSGLTSYRDIRDAQATIERHDLPWLVVTTMPRGPSWGALLESGAARIVEASIGIVEIAALLEPLLAGRIVHDARAEDDLRRQWRDLEAERSRVAARLAGLTSRELMMLGRLYAGRSVSQIAAEQDTLDAAVQEQVRELLAKLDLGSQLAAVERLGELRVLDVEDGSVGGS